LSPAVLTGVATPPLFPTQPTEGAPFTAPFATVFDGDATLAPSDFKVTINWGDGTALDTTTGSATAVSGSPNTFSISGSHTYTEESSSVTPPFNFTVTLTVTDTKNNITTTIDSSASVADANLSQGNPVTQTGQTFQGGGSGQQSTSAALSGFEAAIGGSKNTTAAPQTSGFRTITWDGVKTNGTDSAAGPNSTTVITSNTVGIPLDRFQGSGVYFGAIYAVSAADSSGFTFTNTNANVSGLFPPFSTPNTFAMFNDNGIDFKFVAASATNTDITNAASRGFGAVFLNVEMANTTSIQYFNGNTLLDTVFAPVGGKGAAVFVGELFPSSIVTRVVLTLGTDAIFKFDGTTLTPSSLTDNGTTTNFVVTDDWAFAEPQVTPNGLPIVTGAAGTALANATINATSLQPFTGVVGNFSDLDPNGNAKDFTATINWGDGHLTNATITANSSGGFDVSGTNTYFLPGTYAINVDVMDFGGGPGFNGSGPTVSINDTLKVTAAEQTIGGFDSASGMWFLDPVNAPSAPSPAPFAFGAPGFKPVIGDWNNDGTQTVGVFDPGISFGDPNTGMWFIRNENSAGPADAGTFAFGFAGGIPISGDWNGSGKTGIGIFDPSTGTFFLRNEASGGAADEGTFKFGMPGFLPVVGDWTGSGHTGIGVFDPTTGTFFLRNEPNAGAADAGTFAFGGPGFLPLAGDWTGIGKTGIGVFLPSTATFFLRSEANGGAPDAGQFAFGLPTFLPVAGHYVLAPSTSALAALGELPTPALLDNAALAVATPVANQTSIGPVTPGVVVSTDVAALGWSGGSANPPELLTTVPSAQPDQSSVPQDAAALDSIFTQGW
jgi:hypothetical protein